MNQKKPLRGEANPTYLHHVQVRSGSKTYNLHRLMWISMRPGARTSMRGRWQFLYAEEFGGKLLLHVGQGGRSRIITEDDIRTVHIKTKETE